MVLPLLSSHGQPDELGVSDDSLIKFVINKVSGDSYGISRHIAVIDMWSEKWSVKWINSQQ